MKRLALILTVGLAVAIGAGACACGGGLASSGQDAALDDQTAQAAQFTAAEQEIYDYCEANIDDLDDMVDELNSLVEEEDYAPTHVANVLEDIVADYKDLNESWMDTNGGDLAGGEVRRLETLWEDCAENARLCASTIVDVYADPDSVTEADTTAAGKALAHALTGVDDIREELGDLAISY